MEISKQREWLNDYLFNLSNEVKYKDVKILHIGKSKTWDYRSMFTNGHSKDKAKCQFIESDIDYSLRPQVLDDICNSKFKDNEFDYVIFNGVFEQIRSKGGVGFINKKTGIKNGISSIETRKLVRQALKEIYRILKSGGVLIAGITGIAYPVYGDGTTDTGLRTTPDEFTDKYMRGVWVKDELIKFYRDNENEAGLQYFYLIIKNLK